LLDGDILPYEIGAVCENFRSERRVMEMVDQLIELILDRTGASHYEVFLSEKGNFRLKVASVKKYKGTRHKEKPRWWGAIRNHLYEHHSATAVTGCEADDALSIRQRAYLHEGVKSCIASRDKDLRICPGYHYSWACGKNQSEKPLYLVTELGELWPKWGTTKAGKPTIKDLKGTGLKFFYSQLIMGDSADNIPGAPGKGTTYAFEAIDNCTSEEEMYGIVLEAYRSAYKCYKGKRGTLNPFISYTDWRGKLQRKRVEDVIREQGILLWMQREEGEMWNHPNGLTY
jgi:hypothetical protein